MKIVLTGGIASGKSAVSKILSEKFGFAVTDADDISREVTAKGSVGAKKIEQAFGAGFFADGVLDRKALGAHVFADADRTRRLNGILHPLIYDALQTAVDASGARDAVIGIPLYFDSTRRLKGIDSVWTVSAPENLRIERLTERDTISVARALSVLKRQLTDGEREAKADRVIDNSGTLAELEARVAAAVAQESGWQKKSDGSVLSQ